MVTRRGWILFAAMCLIWGIPYLLIKIAVRELTPASLVLMRTGIGALLLVPLAAARGQLRPLLPRWRPLLAYTAAEVAIPWFLLSDAERKLPSSLTGLLIAAVPLIGAVLARLTGGADILDRRRIAGLLVGLAGVGVLLGFSLDGGDLRSVAEVGLVAIGYAIGPMLVAGPLAGLPGTGVVAASLGLCALAYAPAGIRELPSTMPSPEVIWSVIILGVVCTAVAFIIFFALIGEVGPVRATVITYVNPAVAVALGVLVLGESFTVSTAAAFVLILGGSFLATRANRRPEPVPVPDPG